MKLYVKVIVLVILSLLIFSSIQFANDIQEKAYSDTSIEYRTDWLEGNSFSGSFSIKRENDYLIIKPTFSASTVDNSTTDQTSYQTSDLLTKGSLTTSSYWASSIKIGCNGKAFGWSADMVKGGSIYLPIENAKTYLTGDDKNLEFYYYHRVPHKGGMAVVTSQVVWGNTNYQLKESKPDNEKDTEVNEDTKQKPVINDSLSNKDVFQIINNPNESKLKSEFDDIFLRNYKIRGTVYIKKFGTNKKVQITEANKNNIGIKPGDIVYTDKESSITLYSKKGGLYTQGSQSTMKFTASSHLSEDEEKTYLGMLEDGKMSYLTNDSLSDEMIDNTVGKDSMVKDVIYSVASFFSKNNEDNYNVLAGARSAYTMEITDNGVEVELIDGNVDLEVLETGKKFSLESGEKVSTTDTGEFNSVENFDIQKSIDDLSENVGFEIKLKEKSSGGWLLKVVGVIFLILIIIIFRKIKGNKNKEKRNVSKEEMSFNENQNKAQNQFLNSSCPSCGAKVTKDMKFCGKCGTKIEKVKRDSFCTNCGKKVKANDKFCPHCGNPVK